MTTAIDLTSCLVCGSTDRHSRPLGGLLRHCPVCQFCWTAADSPAPQELYDDEYFCGEGYEDYYRPAARRHEAQVRINWLRQTGAITSLLEAGSAGGFFVEAARAAGIAAQGIEISPAATHFALEQLGVELIQGAFETAVIAHRVQAVCAFHVLEHVENPADFLTKARDVLEPGGLLFIEVPNISAAAARRLGTSWPGLQPKYHRWHFNPRSLTRLVSAAGFDVIFQDTAVFRFYMPAHYRRHAARNLAFSDLRNLHSLRLTHPDRGDLLRLVARKPDSSRGAPVPDRGKR